MNVGHEKAKTRPVLVLNFPKFGPIALVAPLTKMIKLKPDGNLKYRSHYVLKRANYPFLKMDSAVQCELIRAIDKSRLGTVMGVVRRQDLRRIQMRVKYVFDLS